MKMEGGGGGGGGHLAIGVSISAEMNFATQSMCIQVKCNIMIPSLSMIYRIAGKVGGSYIWRFRYFCCLAEFNLAVAHHMSGDG